MNEIETQEAEAIRQTDEFEAVKQPLYNQYDIEAMSLEEVQIIRQELLDKVARGEVIDTEASISLDALNKLIVKFFALRFLAEEQ